MKKFIPVILGLIILGGIITLKYLYQSTVVIVGHSMEPRYANGEYYFIHSYTKKLPQRGDVVVYKRGYPESTSIGRIVGLPGEDVLIRNGVVFINNAPLQEPYLERMYEHIAGEFLPDGKELTIPTQSYIVLGDNRPISYDSKDFGFVTADQIKGKISTCFYHCRSTQR